MGNTRNSSKHTYLDRAIDLAEMFPDNNLGLVMGRLTLLTTEDSKRNVRSCSDLDVTASQLT